MKEIMDETVEPIIIVHRGADSYLRYVIKQAERTGNTVFLLGDETNRSMCRNWYSLSDYESERLNLFRNQYVHMSTNSEQFEKFCFERHFYIYEFALRNQLDDLLMMDSDVLVYQKMSKKFFAGIEWSGYFNTDSQAVSPHFSYFKREELRKFLSFCCELYSEKRIGILKERWKGFCENNLPGGNCDMTALYYWMLEAGNMYNWLQDNSITNVISASKSQKFDLNKEVGIVKFRFRNGKVYAYINGEETEIIVIHAQGGTKLYIPTLYHRRNSNSAYQFMKKRNSFLHFLHRVRVKVFKSGM